MVALLGNTGSVLADSSGGGAAAIVFVLIGLALAVVVIAGMWKMFVKAGQKGWFAIIPILNLYILIKMAGREGWWILLFLIPCVNFIVGIIVYIDVAKQFGKDTLYGVAMYFIPVVFIPILGFGQAEYQGDKTPIL